MQGPVDFWNSGLLGNWATGQLGNWDSGSLAGIDPAPLLVDRGPAILDQLDEGSRSREDGL